ncbi:hypothetical protein GCK72_011387 [Caenorhabditis remanei]|uniref:F-box domain-containing protein n=1 Tax=Caenorhabditis remanei TaxID=31234 RepID=A0A6A5H8D0_CAERE|nr:hypothetical protein GCK72_011387 [Caenorhabditis remanei]KAF1763121.1 hypothetical protein GCK72_011387 [Caenorhabditis remanei]
MSQPFKLFRLPIVALRNVLELLDPIELFDLSQCSRRSLSIIPLSGSRKFKLRMNNNYSFIHILAPSNVYSFRMYENSSQSKYILHGTRTFMESTVTISRHSEYELYSFWDDRFVGLKTVFFHLSKIFNCGIESAKFYTTIPAVINMPIIDFIISRQSEIKELHISGKNFSDEHVIEIFDKLRVTDRLLIRHEFSMSPPLIPFNSKSIDIWKSYWITTEHLNSMRNSTLIQLNWSTLTDRDMTSFLNDWKSGQFPNLQYLSIQSNFLSKNFTAFGLPSLQDTVDPQDHQRIIFGYPRSIYGGVDVQRDDGVVANVHFDNEEGVLEILVLS